MPVDTNKSRLHIALLFLQGMVSNRNIAMLAALFIIGFRIFPIHSLFEIKFLYFVLPVLYLVIVWVSFCGLGAKVSKDSEMVVQVAVGMAVAALVFALLSAANFYNPSTVSAAFLIGALFYAQRQCSCNVGEKNSLTLIGFGAVFALLIAIVMFIRIFYPVFNIYDDYAAYLPFIKKLAFSGTLGQEPFSERRLISSLDAYYYLNAATLYFLPMQFARLFDTVFCSLCLCILALRFAGFGLGALFATLYMFFPQQDINTLPYYLVIFLIFATAITLFRADFIYNKSAILTAALVSALTFTVRSSSIPLVVFMAAFSFLYWCFFNKKNIKDVFHAYVRFALILMPCVGLFSALHRLQAGTFLFPVLGMGGHASQYMDYYNPASSSWHGWKGLKLFIISVQDDILQSLLFKAISIITVVSMALLIVTRKYLPVIMVGGCVFGLLVFLYSLGAGSGAAMRYAQPYFIALLGVVAFSLYQQYGRMLVFRQPQYFILFAIVVALLNLKPIISLTENFVNYNSFPDGKDARAILDDFSKPELSNSYAELGRHIPNDAKTIARVSYPFLLNLTPDILIMDLAGGASPKPGIPYDAGAEAVANYFLQQGIRYVAWDYKRRAFYDDVSFRCDIYYCVPWIDSSVKYIRKTASIFDELMISRKNLYNNDGIVLFDMAQKN